MHPIQLQLQQFLFTSYFFVLVVVSADDSVYMEKEIDRDEYVLADFGYIWVGTSRNNEGIPWQFGQVKFPIFSPDSLKMNCSPFAYEWIR